MTIQFRSIAYALPTKLINNDAVVSAVMHQSRGVYEGDLKELEQQIHSMFQMAGTRIRYHRSPTETALDLGIAAGEQALADSGVSRRDIDLLLYVGVGRGFLEPATFNVFQDALKLEAATGFDVLDACASWMRAVHVARSFIEAGTYRNVMILNAEFNVREYERLQLRSLRELEYAFPALTIGEAASATVISSADAHVRDDVGYAADFRSVGNAHDLCKIPLPNIAQYSRSEKRDDFPPLKFYSFGERLFQFGFSQCVKHFRTLPAFQNCKERSEAFFFHSASQAVAERIGKVLELRGGHHTHEIFGNTVSASLPVGMAHAIAKGHLKRGMEVVLGCGSAGFSSGWTRFRYV